MATCKYVKHESIKFDLIFIYILLLIVVVWRINELKNTYNHTMVEYSNFRGFDLFRGEYHKNTPGNDKALYYFLPWFHFLSLTCGFFINSLSLFQFLDSLLSITIKIVPCKQKVVQTNRTTRGWWKL